MQQSNGPSTSTLPGADHPVASWLTVTSLLAAVWLPLAERYHLPPMAWGAPVLEMPLASHPTAVYVAGGFMLLAATVIFAGMVRGYERRLDVGVTSGVVAGGAGIWGIVYAGNLWSGTMMAGAAFSALVVLLLPRIPKPDPSLELAETHFGGVLLILIAVPVGLLFVFTYDPLLRVAAAFTLPFVFTGVVNMLASISIVTYAPETYLNNPFMDARPVPPRWRRVGSILSTLAMVPLLVFVVDPFLDDHGLWWGLEFIIALAFAGGSVSLIRNEHAKARKAGALMLGTGVFILLTIVAVLTLM